MTHFPETGTFVGRIWSPDLGPVLVHLRAGVLHDVTTKDAPTMRDLLELEDPLAYLQAQPHRPVANLEELLALKEPRGLRLLAPSDLQAIKACGVTFARSMIERVIEERAA